MASKRKYSEDNVAEDLLHRKIPRTEMISQSLVAVSGRLRDDLNKLVFNGSGRNRISHVYNPLQYAWDSHAEYLTKFGCKSPVPVMLIGLNPGPWGMTQTGVPFGEINVVKEFLNISTQNLRKITSPDQTHPKRKIDGINCRRSEVSGRRLWSFLKRRFSADCMEMRESILVYNYCPLVFMSSSGANVTPDKLPEQEREALFGLCDTALMQAVGVLKPRVICAAGAIVGERCTRVFKDGDIPIAILQHPSPASPQGAIWEKAVNFDQLILKSKSKVLNVEALIINTT